MTALSEFDSTPHENMSINYSKQEESFPPKESVTPSPHSLKMMEREPAKTETKHNNSKHGD